MKNYLRYGASAIVIITMTAFAQAQTNERQQGPQTGTSAHEPQSGHKGGGEAKAPSQGAQTRGSQSQEQHSGRGSQSAQTGTQAGKAEHAQESGAQHKGKSASEQKQAGSQKSAQEHEDSAGVGKDGERNDPSEHRAENQKENRTAGGKNARASTEESHRTHVNINITPVEKTRIHQVIERDSGIRKYSHSDVHFGLNVGTRVPETVVLYSPPPQLISISADLRGYKIIVVDDILIVIDPETREIVDVLEV